VTDQVKIEARDYRKRKKKKKKKNKKNKRKRKERKKLSQTVEPTKQIIFLIIRGEWFCILENKILLAFCSLWYFCRTKQTEKDYL
jgi:cytoskeletal protein RodZ